MMLQLRNYQKECLQTLALKFKEKKNRLLVSMPTGSGKTIIFSHMARRISSKVLILAHRDELINQTMDKLEIVCPEISIGVIKAERNDFSKDVTIASVQTLSRNGRLEQLKDTLFDLVITDEAHHAAASSYKRIYEKLLYSDNQKHVGFTATANRTDKIGLDGVFSEIAYHRSILDMIREGWLSDLRCLQISTDISLDDVKTHHGDFAVGNLASVINTANRNELIVDAYKKHASDRLVLCFTVNVQHAIALSDAFCQAGIASEYITGNTEMSERHDILKRYHNREIQVLCNCQVLTEGYDEPATDCIILARPTKSSLLYTQMIGRGTRTFPEKKDCLILDVADNANKHNIVQFPDLIGAKRKDYKLDGSITLTKIAKREEGLDAEEFIGRGIKTKEVNIFNQLDFAWIKVDNKYLLKIPYVGDIKVVPTKYYNKYAVLFYDYDKRESVFLSPKPIEQSWAFGVAEAKAREIGADNLVLIKRDAKWRSLPASPEQKIRARKEGIDGVDNLNRGQLHDKISAAMSDNSRKKQNLNDIKKILKPMQLKLPF